MEGVAELLSRRSVAVVGTRIGVKNFLPRAALALEMPEREYDNGILQFSLRRGFLPPVVER